MQTKQKKVSTRTIAVVGIMAAIAFVLQMLGMLLPRVGGFLDIEISDLPAMLTALAVGPLAGVAVELIKNLLHCTVTTTGFVGEFANLVMNGIFVFVLGMLYRRNKTKKNAVISLGISVLVLAAAGVAVNLLVMLPLYMPAAPLSVKLELVLKTILPFNLVRGSVLSVLIMLLYKHVSGLIKG